MNKLPIKSWEEEDCFTEWRKFLRWQKGVIKKAKRRYSKRVRRWHKIEINNQLRENINSIPVSD